MIAVIFETNGEPVLLRPDEIADEDTIAQGVNAKSSLTLYIYPQFEAWKVCQRTITYVRVLDLDKPSERLIFKGRVAGVTDSVDSSGRAVQAVVCASALDFLEDSASYIIDGSSSGKSVSAALDWVLDYHNDCVGANSPRRLFKGTTDTGMFYGETKRGSSYAQLMEMITTGVYRDSLLRQDFEFRERYVNDDTYIDILERPDAKKDTAIMIGDNLKDITVERGVSEGIVNSIIASSGRCVDGNDIYVTVSDSASIAQYGKYERRLRNEEIYSNAPHWTQEYVGGAWVAVESNTWLAARSALYEWASLQLEKANDPYVKIKLTAFDLEKIGLSGYDGFELGNTYPVICPQLELYEDMRITGIERKLARGEVVSITIEKGQKLDDNAEKSLSEKMWRLEQLNASIKEETDAKTDDITDAKIVQVTDDWVVKEMNEEQYENLPSTSKFKTKGICVVRNQPGDDVKLYVGGTHIDSGGGGVDRGTIENAVVLTSEQGTEWAPDHELTPVWFRGTGSIYYGQSPARFVAQGQRVLHGVADANIVADDIISEFDLEMRTGAIKRFRTRIYQIDYYSNVTRFYPICDVYDVTDGTEVYEGGYGNYQGWGIIDVPIANTSWKIGVVLTCSGWSTSGVNVISPNISMRIYGWGDVSGVLSNQYLKSFSPPYNPVPVSQAESDFGVTITTKTEPVAPT